MFGSVGVPELIIIFTIALIIFGPRKLPELGKSLGKSLAEFKRASNELKSTLEEEIRIESEKQLAFVQKDAGVKLEGHHEFTVASGRIDSGDVTVTRNASVTVLPP